MTEPIGDDDHADVKCVGGCGTSLGPCGIGGVIKICAYDGVFYACSKQCADRYMEQRGLRVKTEGRTMDADRAVRLRQITSEVQAKLTSVDLPVTDQVAVALSIAASLTAGQDMPRETFLEVAAVIYDQALVMTAAARAAVKG